MRYSDTYVTHFALQKYQQQSFGYVVNLSPVWVATVHSELPDLSLMVRYARSTGTDLKVTQSEVCCGSAQHVICG